MDYTDIRYEVEAPVATVTIDRPDRMNAFRGRTIEELLHAFKRAWADKSVAAVILTGSGEKAFCVGVDQKEFIETGRYGTSSNCLWAVEAFPNVLRDIPKPGIAAVNGFPLGVGHGFPVVCA